MGRICGTEVQANRYLRKAGGDPAYPAHTEEYFARQDEHNRIDQARDDAPLLDEQTNAVLRHAIVMALRQVQADYPRLHRSTEAFQRALEGETYVAIADALRIERRTAAAAVRRVLRLVIPMIQDEEIWLVGHGRITPRQMWWLLSEIFGEVQLGLAGYQRPE